MGILAPRDANQNNQKYSIYVTNCLHFLENLFSVMKYHLIYYVPYITLIPYQYLIFPYQITLY